MKTKITYSQKSPYYAHGTKGLTNTFLINEFDFHNYLEISCLSVYST